MPLTDHERARLRAMWRALQVAGARLDPEAMKAVSGDVLGMASPMDSKAEAFSLFAFARLTVAYVKGGAGYRIAAGPVLTALAGLIGDLLDASDPRAPPLTLPFRADLDG